MSVYKSIECIDTSKEFKLPNDLKSIFRVSYVNVSGSITYGYKLSKSEYSHDIFNLFEITRPEGKEQVSTSMYNDLDFDYKVYNMKSLLFTLKDEPRTNKYFFQVLNATTDMSYLCLYIPPYTSKVVLEDLKGNELGQFTLLDKIHMMNDEGDYIESCHVYLRLGINEDKLFSEEFLSNTTYLKDEYVDYLMSNSIGSTILSTRQLQDYLEYPGRLIDKDLEVPHYGISILSRGQIGNKVEHVKNDFNKKSKLFQVGLGYHKGDIVLFRGIEYESLRDWNLSIPHMYENHWKIKE